MAQVSTQPALDTSNYVKHTSGNPIQRKLIDRFHEVILERIVALRPATFLGRRLRRGLRRPAPARAPAEPDADRLRLQPGLRRHGAGEEPDRVVPGVQHLRHPDGRPELRRGRLLRGPGAHGGAREGLGRARPGGGPAMVISVPHEPYFCLANAARGKNLDIRPAAPTPTQELLDQAGLRRVPGRHVPQFQVTWLGGSLPWTICVAIRA
jgi:hypothetical protein